MAESKKVIEERKKRKERILKARDESGYLSTDELFQFLKSKGIDVERNSKNIPRFARNNNISSKRFGRIGKKGGDPLFYKKPNQEQIQKIFDKLKYETNNSYPGRKLVAEKKKIVLSIFDKSKDKEKREEKDRLYRYSIAEQIAKKEGIPTNRMFVAKVLDDERTAKEIKQKLNRPAIPQK